MYPSGSLDTKILYLEPFQKFFSHPSVSLSSSIGFHPQPCSKGLRSSLLYVISKLLIYVLSHGCLLSLYKALFNLHKSLIVMCLDFQWLQMSLRSLCLLFVRSLVLRIFPCILRCCHLLHVGYYRSIWKTL